MNALVERGLELVRSLNVPVGVVIEKAGLATAPVNFYTLAGTITFQFLAGKLGGGVDRYEPTPPTQIYSRAVQTALGAIDKISQQTRIAVFGERRENRRYVLEVVILTGDDGEAVLALDLHDHHFNRTEAERLFSQRQLAGLFVEYTGETVLYDGEDHLKLQIVFVGTFEEFDECTGNNLVLREELEHPGSGVYRIAPGNDWTDDWGYLIIGDMSDALLILQNHIPSEFVVVG